jgi:muramoyltetrapeptide carboxypeptidase
MNPKWLIGFSDVTVFHAHLARHKIASIHGVMPSKFEHDGGLTDSFLKLMEMLAGNAPDYQVPAHELNRTGTASGILTGGNLSIIQSLRGTALDIRPKGKILLIEDIHELHYHLDRMMQNLKAGGVLEQLSGLIVGYFTRMRDGETPFGRTACQIIREAVEPYDYPVVFGFPSGHELPNHPLLMGSRISLEVSDAGATIGNNKR